MGTTEVDLNIDNLQKALKEIGMNTKGKKEDFM